MSLEISLWKLEDDLTSLIQMREEATDREEIAVLDEQLRIYFTAEIRKVDGVRSFWRHCEFMAAGAAEEARVQSDRAQAWKRRLETLKGMCKGVLEMMEWPEGKPKKLEGRTGAISLKANGGKQAVVITDESLVPDEFCVIKVEMRASRWRELAGNQELPDIRWQKVPSLTLIGKALEEQCAQCQGAPNVRYEIEEGIYGVAECEACGGSGKAGVPGARLEPRSSHVECR